MLETIVMILVGLGLVLAGGAVATWVNRDYTKALERDNRFYRALLEKLESK